MKIFKKFDAWIDKSWKNFCIACGMAVILNLVLGIVFIRFLGMINLAFAAWLLIMLAFGIKNHLQEVANETDKRNNGQEKGKW